MFSKNKVEKVLERYVEPALSWFMKSVILLASMSLFLSGNKIGFLTCIFAFAISIIPSVVEASFRVNLPKVLDFFVTLFLVLYAVVVSGMFSFWNIDKLAHILFGLSVGMIAFCVLFILIYHTKQLKLDYKLFFLFVVFTSIAIGSGLEIWEWATNKMLSLNLQDSINNVMLDMISNTIGGIIIAIFGIIWLKNTPNYELKRVLNSPRLVKFVKKEI